ncbi:MAG: DNA polymerase IV [Spirochaetaceae bacterium]|nr:DNA polymerase IV [Spirochaetaceae bacterium]
MFLHVDLDAFFASVEQLDNPKIKGKPVIVGALPGTSRGVVSTCSYEARQYGVHSAMPIERAYKLCPCGIFIEPRMNRYHQMSEQVMSIFSDFSPEVQQMSVDEAFVDLTGTERLFGSPEKTAQKLKSSVLEQTGLTVSVGLATNKYVAKIASSLAKPDGFFHVKTGSEKEFMSSIPLNKVWGIGGKSLEKLKSAGLISVIQVQQTPLPLLESILGKAGGMFLYKAVRGMEAESFSTKQHSHSISAENTFETDLYDKFIIGTALMDLCHTVMFRLLREGWRSRTICVKIRYNDFSTYTIQDTYSSTITSVEELFQRATTLLEKKYDGRGLRLLGVAATNLESIKEPEQGLLFNENNEKQYKVHQAILSIKDKNPNITITKARLIK